MAQIPPDITREVFLRLPPETLLRARAVCREWCNIIDDKSFIDSHSIRSQLSSTTLLFKNPSSTLLYSISVDSLINCAHGNQENLEATSIPAFNLRGFSRVLDFSLPSCNGLILLHSLDPKTNGVILNPFTLKFHNFPQLPRFVGYPFVGLGYDPSSDDYKVVALGRYPHLHGYSYDSYVYSMKTGSWRKIEDDDHGDHISACLPNGVFVNGFLHWKSKINYCLIRFNLATELYDEVPLPDTDREVSFWDFGLLDGCLVVSLYYMKERCLEGWVMKGGGWTELFIVNTNGFFMPIAYLKRRKGLVLLTTRWNKKLYLLDIEKNSLRMVNIQGLPHEISSLMCFSGSLIQLEESYGFTAKTSRAHKGANARVKLSVTTTSDVRLISSLGFNSV